MGNKNDPPFDLVLFHDDDVEIIFCLTKRARKLVDGMCAEMEWSKQGGHHLACIDHECANEFAIEAAKAGLRVAFAEHRGDGLRFSDVVEPLRLRLH
jgi:hypothetical protein